MASFYETIKEINETADIVAVIGKYIKLSKQGANYMGVCPFHPDTSPSLCVSPKKHIWKCFVCGAGGKAIDFVQQFKKCTLEEAVKIVAEDTGYDISKIQSNFKGSYLDPKLKRLYDANKQVNEWYQGFLFNEENKDKLNYLLKRGLSIETIKQFQIGCAPEDKTIIYNMLTNKNNMFGDEYDKNLIWTEQELIDAGIVNVLQDGRILDFLSNRITFPIYNNEGLLSGFSGRSTNGDEPKYLNSKETIIFNKSKIFYNMNNAIWEKSDKLILVEGYMDVIAFHTAGFKKVVGTMGVALSKDHLAKLHQMNDIRTIILGFDNDEAGKQANINIGRKLIEEKFNVYVVGKYEKDIKDIDELIKKEGKDGIENIINNRRDYITFLIDATFEKQMQQDELVAKANSILNFIAQHGDPLLKTIHLNKLADSCGLSLLDLENKYDSLKGIPYKKKIVYAEKIPEVQTKVRVAPKVDSIFKERILNDLKEIISLCIGKNNDNLKYIDLIDLHVLNGFCPIQTKILKAIHIMGSDGEKISIDTLKNYLIENLEESNSVIKYLKENISVAEEENDKSIMEYLVKDLKENILNMMVNNKVEEINTLRKNGQDFTKQQEEYNILKKKSK